MRLPPWWRRKPRMIVPPQGPPTRTVQVRTARAARDARLRAEAAEAKERH